MSMYKDIEAYNTMEGFIEGYKDLWSMFIVTYKLINSTTLCLYNKKETTTWKLIKGRMQCLTH